MNNSQTYYVRDIKQTAPNRFHVIKPGTRITHSCHESIEEARAIKNSLNREIRRVAGLKAAATRKEAKQ